MNDATLWRAVTARDPRREHEFVYAVGSTGIYCRASCPSRRPARSTVRFFATPDAAESAGFRACRRCHPRNGGTQAWVETVLREIDARLDAPLRLADVAARLRLSPAQLQRRFRTLVGLSPRQYAEARRTERLKRELRRAPRVVDAVYEAGFGSGSRVYESAARRLGMTPGAYRRRGEGISVRFTIARSAWGHLLLARTERGLVAATFGDDPSALEQALASELPSATIVRDDRGLRKTAQVVLASLHRDKAVDLPLDVRASTFEWKVWDALRRIPRGQTRTYGEIARAVGQPKAARAVGTACAKNRLALVIPCHRVVPASGGTGRYRWGAARKRALLEAEKTRGRGRAARGAVRAR